MRKYPKSGFLYAAQWIKVWHWPEFPSCQDFSDIDLVARAVYGDYWTVQRKYFKADTRIDKPIVDTSLSTSGKSFYDVNGPRTKVHAFCPRLLLVEKSQDFWPSKAGKTLADLHLNYEDQKKPVEVTKRYAVTTHKENGIKNAHNDWAMEHGNLRYILDLLLSVITIMVSVKTADIVAELPKVEWK
jgi:predicted helicase